MTVALCGWLRSKTAIQRLDCDKDASTWATRNRVYSGGDTLNEQRYEKKQTSYELTVRKFRNFVDGSNPFHRSDLILWGLSGRPPVPYLNGTNDTTRYRRLLKCPEVAQANRPNLHCVGDGIREF